MPFYFSPLRSGSSGNALLAQAGNTRILVDAGLSGRAIEGALAECGVTPDTLSAILISHEHSDHTRGVAVLSRKYDLPVYATEGTWTAMEGCIDTNRIALKNRRAFTAGQDFYVHDVLVSPFSIPHDAADPVGFSLLSGVRKLSIATDLGHIAPGWMRALAGSDLVLLESNHDPELLRAHPRYPARLKTRILGKRGHLSNAACGEALVQLISTGVTNVILGHLSGETNRPELALSTVLETITEAGIRPGDDMRVALAHRERNGGLYTID